MDEGNRFEWKKIEKKEMEEEWDKGGGNGGKERKGEKVKVL